MIVPIWTQQLRKLLGDKFAVYVDNIVFTKLHKQEGNVSGIYKDKCKCVSVITEELFEKDWNNVYDKFKNSFVSTEDF